MFFNIIIAEKVDKWDRGEIMKTSNWRWIKFAIDVRSFVSMSMSTGYVVHQGAKKMVVLVSWAYLFAFNACEYFIFWKAPCMTLLPLCKIKMPLFYMAEAFKMTNVLQPA